MGVTDADSRRTKAAAEPAVEEKPPLDPKVALNQCIETLEQVEDPEDQQRVVKTLATFYGLEPVQVLETLDR